MFRDLPLRIPGRLLVNEQLSFIQQRSMFIILNSKLEQVHFRENLLAEILAFHMSTLVGCCLINSGKQRDCPLEDNDSMVCLFLQR